MKRITLIIFIFVVGTILCLETIKKSQAGEQSKTSTETIKADSSIAQSFQVQSSIEAKPLK